MSTPQYTVLRIKRKATDSPLSSLVISDGQQRAAKRRDVSRTLPRSRGVFRLADTVPETWKGQGPEGEQLKSRIEVLLATGSGSASGNGSESGTPATSSTTLPSQPETASLPTKPTQYRVVPRLGPLRQDPNLPPRVITLAEIEEAKSALLLVDAQAVKGEEGEDKDMAAFQSMLSEYLKLEGSDRPPLMKDDDEYVYDLYYRDVSGDVSGEGYGALLGYEDLSPPSTPPDSEPEDEADEDSNDEDYYRNDYPEDEDADEDMAGFEDAYSDGAWSADEEADNDERDPWEDYR